MILWPECCHHQQQGYIIHESLSQRHAGELVARVALPRQDFVSGSTQTSHNLSPVLYIEGSRAALIAVAAPCSHVPSKLQQYILVLNMLKQTLRGPNSMSAKALRDSI